MRWTQRGAALIIGLVILAACTPPSSNRPRPAVTLIGDSTMAGMVWYEGATHPQEVIRASYNLTITAESCRRLVVPSCRGRFGYVPTNTVQALRGLRGRLGQTLVVMAGYDDVDIASGIDAVMAEANAQGVKSVIWLTYRTDVPYVLPSGFPARNLYTRHNTLLFFATYRYPTLHTADWNAYSRGRRGWLAADGIHMTPGGAVELAKFIKGQLDRWCPAPAADDDDPDDAGHDDHHQGADHHHNSDHYDVDHYDVDHHDVDVDHDHHRAVAEAVSGQGVAPALSSRAARRPPRSRPPLRPEPDRRANPSRRRVRRHRRTRG